MTDRLSGHLYHVRYVRDSVNKLWHAEISEVPQIHISAASLDKAEEYGRNALAALLGVQANELHMRHDYYLEGNAGEVVTTSVEARHAASKVTEQAAQRTREAARKLTEELGLTLRDTARILQLSHQRVSQILAEEALLSNAAEVRSRLDGKLRLPPQR